MCIENFEEKELNSKLIYDGTVLHLFVDEVILPDGKKATREYCKHNGGVCVVPVTDDGCILCVKQYRYPHHRITLEIPAGKLEKKGDEDHNIAALRELKEETGATCDKLTYLGEMYPSPAIMDEIIFMYMAEGLKFGENNLDDDEFLEVEKIPINDLVRRICNGDIPDAKTQCAVLRAWKILNGL